MSMAARYRHLALWLGVLGSASGLPAAAVMAQTERPAQVSVNPVARDEEIRNRLQRVLDATEWFTAPQVRVEDGVVFLSGRAGSQDLKEWAGDLAQNTQDVAAVVNQMELPEPSAWGFGPAFSELSAFGRNVLRAVPAVLFGLLVLALSVVAGLLTTRAMRKFLGGRIRVRLLRNVVARAVGVLVTLFGTYVMLRILGLTQLALTIVGGTGLIGLALGIAFRDISENFLASIFLSLQRPFETGDLIEVAGVTGFVQQLNLRTTVLLTLDGTMVQIPNAAVYKSNIHNFTTIPNRRDDFVIGIGYDDSINQAQEIARRVLAEHPAVLSDPEPLVLADSLGSSTVNLRVYFWLDGHVHSLQKVRSSVIRLVKRAFQEHGISMPDEAREVVFPHGVPVTMLTERAEETAAAPAPGRRPETATASEAVATEAEAELSSEAGVMEAQARQAQPAQPEENLLQGAAGATGAGGGDQSAAPGPSR